MGVIKAEQSTHFQGLPGAVPLGLVLYETWAGECWLNLGLVVGCPGSACLGEVGNLEGQKSP